MCRLVVRVVVSLAVLAGTVWASGLPAGAAEPASKSSSSTSSSVVAPDGQAVDGAAGEVDSGVVGGGAGRVRELPDLRTRYSDSYLTGSGEIEQELSLVPVNYRVADGSWQPIDSSLVPSERAGYAAQSAANDFEVFIPGDVDAKPVRVQDDAGWISFNPVAATGAPDVSAASATFDGTNTNTDFRYVVGPTGLREFVELAAAPAAAPIYHYSLHVAEGLTPHLDSSGAVQVTTAAGEVVYTIPAPFMQDSSDPDSSDPDSAGTSDAIETQLTDTGAGWDWSLQPDFGWLSDPARVYPVRIDPDITTTTDDNGGRDCWIGSANPDDGHCTSSQGGAVVLWAGTDSNTANPTLRRSLLRFGVNAIPSAAQVTEAHLLLHMDTSRTRVSTSTKLNYLVRVLDRKWTNDATWHSTGDTPATWTNDGANADTTGTIGTLALNGSEGGWVDWTLDPGAIEGWHEDNDTNDGLLLKMTGSPESGNNELAFDSADNASGNTPKLVVTYAEPAATFVGMSPCQTSCTYPQGGSAWSTGSQLPTFTVDVSTPWSLPNNLDVNYTLKDGSTTLLTDTDDVTRDTSTDAFDESSWTVPKPDPNDPTNVYQGLQDGHSYTLEVAVSDPQRGSGAPVSVTFQVHKSVQGAFSLFEPLKVADHGAVLHWGAYHNNTGDPDNDLYQYEVFRGCLTLPTPSGTGNGCANPVTEPANIANTDQWQLVSPKSGPNGDTGLDASLRTFTDSTAKPSTSGQSASYDYLVVAQTVADHQAGLDGEFVSSLQKNVSTPLAGHVREVFTGDSPQAVVDHLPLAMLSKGKPTTVVGDPNGHPWFEVGDASTPSSLNATHAVMQFDTSDIDPDLQVTSAKLQLTQTSGGGPGTATFQVWNLGQGFDDNTATWTYAADTTMPWEQPDSTPSPGGTTSGTVLDTFTTPSTHTGPVTAADSAAFASVVQGWVGDPTTNDGVLLETSSDTASSQWLGFDSNTAGDSTVQPRLVVDYLATPTPAFRADTMPVRFAPDTITNVPVTVTNTTSHTWTSDPNTPVKLGYWWTDPDGNADDLAASAHRTVNIDTLEPGESKIYQLPVVAPENNTTNANHEQSYDLVIDMILPDGTFASLNGGATGAIYAPAYANYPAHYGINDPKRGDAPCLMVAPSSPRPGGLDCLERVVDGTTDPLGLETSLSYTGQPAGAGSQLLVNNHDGDVLWNYDAWQIPSIGPSSFVTAIYNTGDGTSSGGASTPSGTARGWSFTAGTLNRLGDNPKVSADETSVTLVDGDGTQHVWQLADASSNTYQRPPGVHLKLVHTKGTSEYDFVRPDGTSFDYTAAPTGNTIVPTKIVDHDGNTLTFTTNGQGDVTKATDAAGRDVATLAWDTSNGNNHLTSITAPAITTSTGATQTRTLQLIYDEQPIGSEPPRSSGKDDVTSILDCGDVPTPAGGSYSCPASTFGHLFRFNYCPPTGSCTSNAGPLYSVTDPRNNTSTISYYTSSDTQEVHTSNAIPSGNGFGITNWPKTLTTRSGQQVQFEYYPATDSSKNIETDTYSQAASYNLTTWQSSSTWAETRRLTDPFGRDVAVMDPVNAASHANDSMTSCATAPHCHTTLLGWDADNNAISLTEPGGAHTKWTYDPDTGYPLKQFDPAVLARGGNPTKLTYATKPTAAGPASVVFLKSITTPLGHTTTFTANGNADLASVTDPGANKGTNTIRYAYTTFAMLAGHSAYTLQKVTDANGNTTTYAYAPGAGGATGQPTTITPPPPNAAQQNSSPTELATSLTYNAAGNPLTSTQGTGTTARQTTIGYDGLWRPVKVTTPGAQGNLPRTTTTSYDPNDNVATSKAANGATTSYAYDAADRLTTTHLPGNGGTVTDRQQTSVYDIAGNRICSYTPRYTGSRTSATCATNTGTSIAHSTAYLPDLDGRVQKAIQLGAGGPLVTTGVYDPDSGDLTSVTDPRGNATSYGYDPDHRVVTVTDPAHATTRTRYDNDGRVQSTVDADGNPTDYAYYPNSARKSVTTYRTPAGSNDTQADTTTYQYDHNGNLIKTTLPSGRFSTTQYDQNNNPYQENRLSLPATQAKDLSVTYLGYDTFGELARQSLTLAGDQPRPTDSGTNFDPTKWTQYAYYPSGEIQSSTDPWHIITSYEYNKNGQQTSRTLQGSNPEAQGSNPAGTISVDQSRTMSWSYYPDGSLRGHDDTATLAATVSAQSVALIGGSWQPRTDGPHSLPTYYVHPASSGTDTATWTYNPTATGSVKLQVACPQQSQSGDNPATNATYTITTTSGGGPQTYTATLDQSQCDGDQLWYTPNVNTSDNHIPATNGQQITVTLKTSSTGSVVADNVRFTLPANEGQYAYTYDADGNQIVVNDNTRSPSPVTGAYISCYDDFDRLTKVITTATTATTNGTCGSPSQLSTGYSYDADSNLTQVASTLTARSTSGDAGNSNYSATTKYTWDSRNLLATVTASNSLDVNTSNQPLSRTWTYTYNARGQLATMTKPSGGYTAGNTQVPGNVTSYSYYEDGLLQSSAEVTTGHSTIDSHQLSYDPDGNPSQDILKIIAPTATQHQTANYAFDDAGRLKSVTKHDTDAGSNESYQYFADGTIYKQTIGSGPGSTTTNDEDRGRITGYQATGATKDFNHYDAFGRLHTVTTGSLTGTTVATYDWDGFDRLVHENTTPNGPASSIDKNTSYDPLDRPTLTIAQQGTNPAKKTRYDYVGLTKQVAAEEQPTSSGTSWQVVKGYTDDPAGHSLALSKTPIGATSPTTIRYYTLNPHTDTEALTNPSTGAITQVYRYLAYGSLDTKTNTGRGKVTQGEDTDTQPANASSDNDILNPYRYNDDRADILTGNYDMGFRNYSTSIGQFLSRDMYNGALNDISLGLDPWGVNRYTLGAANPITNVELDGHNQEPVGGDPNMDVEPDVSGKTLPSEGSTGDSGSGRVSLTDYEDARMSLSGMEGMPRGARREPGGSIELTGDVSAVDLETDTESIAITETLTAQEKGAAQFRAASTRSRAIDKVSTEAAENAGAETHGRATLFHYTKSENLDNILDSRELNPSTGSRAHYGEGQYLTDIQPEDFVGPEARMTPEDVSTALYNYPTLTDRLGAYLEVDVEDLDIYSIEGRPNVFVHLSSEPLDLSGRLVRYGHMGFE